MVFLLSFRIQLEISVVKEIKLIKSMINAAQNDFFPKNF